MTKLEFKADICMVSAQKSLMLKYYVVTLDKNGQRFTKTYTAASRFNARMQARNEYPECSVVSSKQCQNTAT